MLDFQTPLNVSSAVWGPSFSAVNLLPTRPWSVPPGNILPPSHGWSETWTVEHTSKSYTQFSSQTSQSDFTATRTRCFGSLTQTPTVMTMRKYPTMTVMSAGLLMVTLSDERLSICSLRDRTNFVQPEGLVRSDLQSTHRFVRTWSSNWAGELTGRFTGDFGQLWQ